MSSDLVQRLSEGDHPVEASVLRGNTLKALRESLDRKYVNIRFTATRGGTELGFSLNPAYSNLEDADFEGGTGEVTVAGDLTLDCVRVRCVARIALDSLTGTGHLVVIEGSEELAPPNTVA